MFLCITGIDGCGKSTQAKLLIDWLKREKGVPAVTFEIWDLLKDPELNSAAFMGRPKELRAYLSELTPVARSLFIFHALFEVLYRNLAAEAEVLIATGYWPKYNVTEVLQGTDAILLESLERFFLEPDLTLLLDLDPRQAAERRTDYSVYECGGLPPTKDSFVQFQSQCQELFLGTAAEKGWLTIEASGSPESVHAAIRAAIEKDGRI